MAMVVRVRFRRTTKLYDFETNNLQVSCGDQVLTETVRGMEIGECMTDPEPLMDEQRAALLKPILRVCTREDLRIQKENEESEVRALHIAEQKIAEQKLDMKLVDVEYAFDRSKITFYFTADGRVDFRLLVKSLASVFKTRIELRQIGVRDEAKMLGGLGPCGRPICCRQFLVDFQPVSIKMAKEQNLSLNPTKISGICDRLMCCLKYEQDNYEQTRKRMPKVGKEVETPDGIGNITAIDVLGEKVSVRVPVGDSFEIRTYPIDDCQRLDKGQRPRAAEERERVRPDENEEKVPEDVQEEETEADLEDPEEMEEIEDTLKGEIFEEAEEAESEAESGAAPAEEAREAERRRRSRPRRRKKKPAAEGEAPQQQQQQPQQQKQQQKQQQQQPPRRPVHEKRAEQDPGEPGEAEKAAAKRHHRRGGRRKKKPMQEGAPVQTE